MQTRGWKCMAMWWLTFIINLAWLGVTVGTPLGMTVWAFPERFNWRGKTHPKCGQHCPWARVPDWLRRKKPAEHQCSSLSASWLWLPCDQLPHAPTAPSSLPSLPHQTVSQNKPFFSEVASVTSPVKAMRKIRSMDCSFQSSSHGGSHRRGGI